MKKVRYDENSISEITPELLKAWKQEYGEDKVHHFEAQDGKECAILTPGRRVIDRAMMESRETKRPSLYTEIVLKEGWLGGDKCFVEEDKYFRGIDGALPEIIQEVEVVLKKN